MSFVMLKNRWSEILYKRSENIKSWSFLIKTDILPYCNNNNYYVTFIASKSLETKLRGASVQELID